LPHLQNSTAGVNRFDPVNKSIFEVYFTLPEALRGEFAKEELLLTEHVLNISGLDALYRAPETDVQKFMGTDRHISKRGSSTLRKVGFETMTCLVMQKKCGDPVYDFIKKKQAEGKASKVAKIAGFNKFLRIYYARVMEVYQ
jgi:hypothetical protein